MIFRWFAVFLLFFLYLMCPEIDHSIITPSHIFSSCYMVGLDGHMVEWFVGCMVGWTVACLNDWIVGLLVAWLHGWIVGSLVAWLNG